MEKRVTINLKELNKAKFAKWLESFDTILTEGENVLWKGGTCLPGALDTINALQAKGKTVYLVTNNTAYSRQELWQHMQSLGFHMDKTNIVTPTYIVAKYLKDEQIKHAYVIGGSGITTELEGMGIQAIGAGPDILKRVDAYINKEVVLKDVKGIGAVVVDFDIHFTYGKIIKATNFLAKNKSCKLFTTQPDVSFADGNCILPGTKAMLAAVQTCVQQEPILLGKPMPVVRDYLGTLDPKRTIVIGTRPEVDVLFGKNCGFSTLLVGEEKTFTKTLTANSKNLPDHFITNFGSLSSSLR